MNLVATLFNFGGRAQRSEFWAVLAPTLSIQIAGLSAIVAHGLFLGSADAALDRALTPQAILKLLSTHPFEAMLAILLPLWAQLAVGARRLNARGRPLWWLAVYLGPALLLAYASFAGVMVNGQGALQGLTVLFLACYIVDLGLVSGQDDGAADQRSQDVEERVALIQEEEAHPDPTTAARQAVEAAIERAIAERSGLAQGLTRHIRDEDSEPGERRRIERRSGMPDLRAEPVERRRNHRRAAPAFGRRSGA